MHAIATLSSQKKNLKTILNPRSRKPSPFPRMWQGKRFPKNRDTRAPNMRDQHKCPLVNRHTRCIPIPQSPSQKPKSQKSPRYRGQRASLPNNSHGERSEGSFDIHRDFDQGGTKKQKTKMRPMCHLAALARLFGPWTRRSSRLQEAFSWRQLVAR